MWLRWAELTREAPGTAHSGTAERLGADEAHKLVLAPLGAHLAKAGPSPVVCGTRMLAAGPKLPSPQSLLHLHSYSHNLGFCISCLDHCSGHLLQYTRLFPNHKPLLTVFPFFTQLLFTLQNPFFLSQAFPNQSPRGVRTSKSTKPVHVWRFSTLPQAHPFFKPGQGPMDAQLECLSYP